MATPTPVLVLGAGELGLSVLQFLAAHPHHPPISVLLRPSTLTSPSPAKKAEISAITSLGISTIPGDIHQATESELSTIFHPFHTIISCTGMAAPPGTQLKLVRTILKARVPRYFPWQFGVDYDVIGRGSSQDLFTEQLDVRDLLRGQSETQWVIVSTGMFMSFLFSETFGVVSPDYQSVHALGSFSNKITVTDVPDIGRVVTEIVCGAPDVRGVVHIAGETVTYGRLADILENITGKEVRREEWGMEKLRGDLRERPGDGVRKYRIVFGEGRGVAWEMGGTWNMGRGMQVRGVEGWVREELSQRKVG